VKPWKTVARRLLADCSPWVRLFGEDIELPDGRRVHDYYTLEMRDFVVILALTEQEQAIVSRNYKHGPRRICLNLPAGYMEEGEPPLETAQRELLEETGYGADEWIALGGFVTNGNAGGGTGHFFLACNARKVAEPNSGDLEEMEIGLMPLDSLLAAVRGGLVPVVSIAAAAMLGTSVYQSYRSRGAPRK
jgi:ADP-ribose pyrophosphatase